MLAAIVAVAACGDSSGPDTYPDMRGSYDLAVGPGYASGTINITGQQDSTFAGDAIVVIPGWVTDTLMSGSQTRGRGGAAGSWTATRR